MATWNEVKEMKQTNESGLGAKILDIEYAAVATLRRGGNKFYVALHAPDIEFWGLETEDRVLVKLVKVKKKQDVEDLGLK